MVFRFAGLFLAVLVIMTARVTGGEVIEDADAFKECKSHCGSEHAGEEERAKLLCIDLCRIWNPVALD